MKRTSELADGDHATIANVEGALPGAADGRKSVGRQRRTGTVDRRRADRADIRPEMKLRSKKRGAVGNGKRACPHNTDVQVVVQGERGAGAIECQRSFRVGAVHPKEGVDAGEIGSLAQRNGASSVVADLEIAVNTDL